MPTVQLLFTSEELQVALLCLGLGKDALVLRVLGHAHQAWDMPDSIVGVLGPLLLIMDSVSRTIRLENRRIISRHLCMQLMDSCSSHLASRHKRIAGFTAEILWVDMCNVEARMHFLCMLPAAGQFMAGQSLSTDDIENEFSCITNEAGFKATLVQVLGYLRAVNVISYIRRMAKQLGLSVPRSADSHCSYQDAVAPSAEQAKHLERWMAKVALNVLGLRRSKAVRAYHSSAGRVQ